MSNYKLFLKEQLIYSFSFILNLLYKIIYLYLFRNRFSIIECWIIFNFQYFFRNEDKHFFFILYKLYFCDYIFKFIFI